MAGPCLKGDVCSQKAPLKWAIMNAHRTIPLITQLRKCVIKCCHYCDGELVFVGLEMPTLTRVIQLPA